MHEMTYLEFQMLYDSHFGGVAFCMSLKTLLPAYEFFFFALKRQIDAALSANSVNISYDSGDVFCVSKYKR